MASETKTTLAAALLSAASALTAPAQVAAVEMPAVDKISVFNSGNGFLTIEECSQDGFLLQAMFVASLHTDPNANSHTKEQSITTMWNVLNDTNQSLDGVLSGFESTAYNRESVMRDDEVQTAFDKAEDALDRFVDKSPQIMKGIEFSLAQVEILTPCSPTFTPQPSTIDPAAVPL